MMSVDVIANRVSSSLSQKIDSLIAETVSDVFGREDTLVFLKQSDCKRVRVGKVETMIINGVPVLEIHPTEIVRSDDEITANFQYRKLYE